MVYADDNTPFTSDENPEVLQDKVQKEADSVSNWFTKNDMVVSSDKTKLLIVATAARRASRLTSADVSFSVNICGDNKSESRCEKLLGITVNQNLTWKNHLYGDREDTGLLNDLSKRISMFRRIRKYLSYSIFKLILSGLFTSKLIYGILWNNSIGGI